MDEAKKYCIWCKKENKLSDTVCVECHKPLDPQENLFLDYLKSHIKDSLKEKVEDTAYSIIKNYLLSHLYGALVALSIVISTGMLVRGQAVEVTKVTQKPAEILAYYEMVETVAETVVETVPVTETSAEYDYAAEKQVLYALFPGYLTSILDEVITMRGGILPETAEGRLTPADYRVSADSEYNGRHEYATFLPDSWLEAIEASSLLGEPSIAFNPEECQSELSVKMMQDGYTVAEMIMNMKLYIGSQEAGELVAEGDCLIVFVYMDDKWLVAEEIMV